MNKKSKDGIGLMVISGIQPARLKGSEAIALKWGNSIVKLIGTDGKTTAAGEYYKRSTGEALPVGGTYNRLQ